MRELAGKRLRELQAYGVLVDAPFRFVGSATPAVPARGLEPAGRMLSCGMTPTLLLFGVPVLVAALRDALESPVISLPAWLLPLTPPFEPACPWGAGKGHVGIRKLAPLHVSVTKCCLTRLRDYSTEEP